jgi:selenium metabolism protein YedF
MTSMKRVIAIHSRHLGIGDDTLGEKLMGSFLRKLWGATPAPDCMLFYNSGVLLLRDDSPVLDALTGLHESGVDLVACGTCCTFYEMTHRLKIGRISDMQEIVSIMLAADSVIPV